MARLHLGVVPNTRLHWKLMIATQKQSASKHFEHISINNESLIIYFSGVENDLFNDVINEIV